jgi:hypothetical protein
VVSELEYPAVVGQLKEENPRHVATQRLSARDSDAPPECLDVRGYTVEALEVLCSTSTAMAGTVTIRSPANGSKRSAMRPNLAQRQR